MCVTTDILLEYEEIIGRQSSPEVAENIVMAIIKNENTVKISHYEKYNLILADPDDNKFVDCAIASRARYIVTEDSHFNILRTLRSPRVDITRLEDYLKELEQSEIISHGFKR